MRINDDSKLSVLLIGLGLGAIGGVMFALLARKETRESLRESSRKTLDYLNQQKKKLRETTEAIVDKGKELMSHRCCSANGTIETQEQTYGEQKQETPGG
jgi:gas vesicle protein